MSPIMTYDTNILLADCGQLAIDYSLDKILPIRGIRGRYMNQRISL